MASVEITINGCLVHCDSNAKEVVRLENAWKAEFRETVVHTGVFVC